MVSYVGCGVEKRRELDDFEEGVWGECLGPNCCHINGVYISI